MCLNIIMCEGLYTIIRYMFLRVCFFGDGEFTFSSQGHYSAFWKLGITGDKVVELVEFVTFYLYVIANRR